jgi:hypothetical protein
MDDKVQEKGKCLCQEILVSHRGSLQGQVEIRWSWHGFPHAGGAVGGLIRVWTAARINPDPAVD